MFNYQLIRLCFDRSDAFDTTILYYFLPSSLSEGEELGQHAAIQLRMEEEEGRSNGPIRAKHVN